jgi:uncharacterized integral membrane protein
MTQQGEVKQSGRRLGGGAIASLSGLAVLLIFVIQNRKDVKVHFLFWGFIWPLWLYTIVIVLFGALVWFGLGVMRRHRRRKERRETGGTDRQYFCCARPRHRHGTSPYDGGGEDVSPARLALPFIPSGTPTSSGACSSGRRST